MTHPTSYAQILKSSSIMGGVAVVGLLLGIQGSHREVPQSDVQHSRADISKAQSLGGYASTYRTEDGPILAIPYLVKQAKL